MSPVKKTREPGKEPPPKASGTQPINDDGPWRYDDQGKKHRNSRILPFENKLKELLLNVSAIVSFQDEFTAIAIQNQAPDIAYGWAKLASEDDRVKRVLHMLLEGSSWADALMPTATLAVAVLWHYGIFIPDKLGVPVSMAAGAIPISREVEQEMKAAAKAEAQQAHAAERATAETAAASDKPINGDDAPSS